MGAIDIIILIIILAFAIIGFKRGVIQSLVTIIGFFAVIYLSYLLKNILGDMMVLNLPFTKFTFIPGGSYVLNIVVYESLAFVLMLIIFGLIYKIVLVASGVFEKLLKITIILGIPSKILGLIVGALEGYVIVYLILFMITQPYIRIDVLNNSKYAGTILKDTPVLSGFADDSLTIISEIDETIKNGNTDNFDLKLTDLILKRKITSVDVMQKLIDDKKISVAGIQSIVNVYKNDVQDDSTE